MSEFLRRRAVEALPAAGDGGAYHVETSAITRLPVMHAPSETLSVSSEQVRALLTTLDEGIPQAMVIPSN